MLICIWLVYANLYNIEKLNYDFSLADKDKAMHSGVIARTIVLDRLTKAYLASHPDAVVVNIACGRRFFPGHVPLPVMQPEAPHFQPEHGECTYNVKYFR